MKASLLRGAPLHPTLHQQRSPLQLQRQRGRITLILVCRSGWQVVANRTRRRSRVTPVRSCLFRVHSVSLAEDSADLSDAHIALREVAEFLAGQTLSVDADTVTFAQHFPRCVFLRCGVMRVRVGPGAHVVRMFYLFRSSPWRAGSSSPNPTFRNRCVISG